MGPALSQWGLWVHISHFHGWTWRGQPLLGTSLWVILLSAEGQFSHVKSRLTLGELGNHWRVGENDQTLWSGLEQNYENLWLDYSPIGAKSLEFASLSSSPCFASEWLCDLGQIHELLWASISPFIEWWWQQYLPHTTGIRFRGANIFSVLSRVTEEHRLRVHPGKEWNPQRLARFMWSHVGRRQGHSQALEIGVLWWWAQNESFIWDKISLRTATTTHWYD